MIDKKTAAYVGIGIFFLLVAMNSTKSIELKEVPTDKPNTLSFDNSALPPYLKPPTRLSENEPIPNNTIKKASLNGINFMPRFDI